MLNYVQEHDVNFIGINISASRDRPGSGYALPGKTIASSQPTVYSRELPVASPFPKQSDKIQRITNRWAVSPSRDWFMLSIFLPRAITAATLLSVGRREAVRAMGKLRQREIL